MSLFAKQTQTLKTNLWLPKGKKGRDKLELWDYRYTLYKIDKQQGLIILQRELIIQYLIITYNGKKSEKEYIYI